MKNRLAIHITAAALFLFSIPLSGHSQDPVPKTTKEARRQFEAADAELNQVYRRCYAGEIVQSQATLQQSQRLWVQCRGLTAAAYQTGESGRQRHDDNFYYYALTVLTRSRIKELNTLFLPR
jgi:uncharacterized protein YecT (DUF1311 family)